jgi:argininosuccinate lyase
MSHLWSGRFDTEPNAAVFDFNASFRFDRRLFEDDCLGSLAWSEALRDAGALSGDDAEAIRGGPFGDPRMRATRSGLRHRS